MERIIIVRDENKKKSGGDKRDLMDKNVEQNNSNNHNIKHNLCVTYLLVCARL